MNLSPFLYGLSELIGLPATLALVDEYGGASFYVPVSMPPGHRLAALIGLDAAEMLSKSYPGERITIALNTTGDHAQQGAKRRAQIRELREQGMSHAQIARALRTTDRTVRRVLGEEVDDRQCALFEL